MKYLKLKLHPYSTLGLIVLSFSALLYMCIQLTLGGIHADVTHTSGAIPTSDAILTLTSLALTLLSVYLFLKSFANDGSREDDKAALRRLKGFALGSLLSAITAIIVFLFALPAVIFGVIALVLSFNNKNKKRKDITIYRLANIFAIVISAVSVYMANYYHY